MKNKLIIVLTLLSLFFLDISCKKYLDVNEDPNNPTDVAPEKRLVGAITLSNGAAMFRGSREVVAICQYGCAEFQGAAETWRMTSAYFFWQNAYTWALPNCVDLVRLGKSESKPEFIGAGEVLMAYNFGILSDQYGSIVLDDYYNGTAAINLIPKFNDQQSVYTKIDSLLDDAIQNFEKAGSSNKLNAANGDIMFHGNIDNWIRFAWALKARYYNHLSKKGSLYNAQDILNACSKAFNGDGMDAEFAHLAGGMETDENPWYSWGGFSYYGDLDIHDDPLYSPRYLTWSQFFVNMLTSFPVTNTLYTDPRISKIMEPAKSDGAYRGLAMGGRLSGGQGLLPDGSPGDPTKTHRSDYGYFSRSGFYTNQTSPTPFITYSEVKFIEAEAKLRSGDASGALNSYKEAVNANMRKLGVNATDIANYWVAQEADGLTAHFNDLTQGLSHIMRQKYIALCLNPETWTDLRRMDYSQDIYGPSFVRPKDLNPLFTGSTQWIRAMCYENNEEARNPDAVNAAGGNSPSVRLLTPVWWDKP